MGLGSSTTRLSLLTCRSLTLHMNAQVIPGIYCAGESAGGFNQHGLGRCTMQGLIGGMNAAAEK